MELAISYKRFSHPSQGKGRSETRQTDETEAYCLRKHHFLIDTYIDRGLSAFHGENTDRGLT
jgi:Resolvase, N terminal domain